MSIDIDGTRQALQDLAEDIEADAGESTPTSAILLQAVDALDLLDEALAEATELSDEIEEALDLVRILGYQPDEDSKVILP